MELSDYQAQAKATIQHSSNVNVDASDDSHLLSKSTIIPLLGLVGEAGSLLSEVKKMLRDGRSYKLAQDKIKEELGDILWYLSCITTSFNLNLNEIAETNLKKNKRRWVPENNMELYDNDYDVEEQIPRAFKVQFKEIDLNYCVQVKISINNVNIGDPLTDNAHDKDGYRYHDALHFTNAAILGWSPVIRALLKRKRKSKPAIDEVEDGARAIITEEAITALVNTYAKNHSYFENIHNIDSHYLTTIKTLVQGLEVSTRTEKEWETAILEGYRIFRSLNKYKGGTIYIDLIKRTIKYTNPL